MLKEGDRKFSIQVLDSCDEYVTLMKKLFDFESLRTLVHRDDFSLCFDGMHGVSGPYALRILGEELGVPSE